MLSQDPSFWKHALPALYRDLLRGAHHSSLNPVSEDYLSYSLQLHQMIDAYREETGDTSVDELITSIKAHEGKRHLTVHFDGGIVRYEGVNRYVAHAFAILEGDTVIAKRVFRGSLHIDELGNASDEGSSMTTNVAEYTAMFSALEYLLLWADDYQRIDLDVYTDSLNLYTHLNGLARSRSPLTLHLRERGNYLLSRFGSYRLHNIPREKNTIVDQMIRQEFKRWRLEEERKD